MAVNVLKKVVANGRKTAARSALSIPTVKKVGAAARKTASQSASSNLTRSAYERIRRAIICARLDLGEALSEQDLATGLGMSKAPVRIALTELRLKGLVVTVPRSGTYVFTPTTSQIEALFDFRLLLEAQALRLSMKKSSEPFLTVLRESVVEMEQAIQSKDAETFKQCDTDFHQALVLHSGNQYLAVSYDTISDVVEALRYRCVDPMMIRNRAFVEHRRILAALEAGQVERAVRVLVKHITRAKQAQASVQWSAARKRRRDYKFRDYNNIL
jgi:DNA-binding GntR family transcriptional regulator